MKSSFRLFGLLTFVICLMTAPSVAQELSPEEKELNKKLSIIKLQKELFDAQNELNKAKKDSIEVNKPKEQSDLEKLNTQKDLLNAQIEIEKSQKGRLSDVPVFTGTEGKINANDRNFIETRLLVQKSTEKAIQKLVSDMSSHLPCTTDITFVMHDQDQLAMVANYSIALSSIEALQNELDKNVKGLLTLQIAHLDAAINDREIGQLGLDPMLPAYAINALLKTTTGIISMFKSDQDIYTQNQLLDESTLISKFHNYISKNDKLKNSKTYYFKIMSPSNSGSVFESKYKGILSTKSDITNKIGEIKDKIESLKANPILFKKYLAIVNKAKETLARAESVMSSINAFDVLLPSASSLDNLQYLNILRAEKLYNLMKKECTYIVKLYGNASGSNIVSTNLWRNPRIKHSAGVEVECMVFNNEGVLVYSSTFVEYQQQTKTKNLNFN